MMHSLMWANWTCTYVFTYLPANLPSVTNWSTFWTNARVNNNFPCAFNIGNVPKLPHLIMGARAQKKKVEKWRFLFLFHRHTRLFSDQSAGSPDVRNWYFLSPPPIKLVVSELRVLGSTAFCFFCVFVSAKMYLCNSPHTLFWETQRHKKNKK